MRIFKIAILIACIFANSFAAPVDSLNKETLVRVGELVRSGNSLHDQHLFDEALKRYFAADSLLPNNEIILYEIANTYCRKGMDSVAIYYAHKSLAAKENEGAFSLLGDVYDNAGKLDSALKYYDLGISFFPKNHLLHFNKAVALTRVNRVQEAHEEASFAVKFTRRHEGSYYIAAVLDFQLKRFDDFVADGLYGLLIGSSEERQNNLVQRFAALDNFRVALAKNDSLNAKQKKSLYNLFVQEGVASINKLSDNVSNAAFYKSLRDAGNAEIFCRYAFQKLDPIAFESWKFIHKSKTNEYRAWIAEYLRGD